MLRIRLVTYNIHKAIGGVDRRYRPERVTELVSALDPDLLLLQEVDEGVPRSRRERQVDVLGDAIGFEHRAYYPNVRLRHGHYGNAILSRFPLDGSENIDLSVRFKKRRGAIHVRVRVPLADTELPLSIFNVHLGLAEYERRVQLLRLLGWQKENEARIASSVIIAGDFNDVWGRLGRVVLEPAGFVSAGRRVLTFPAVRPLRPLDRVFLRGPLLAERLHAPHHRLARLASDHLPLVVDLVVGNVV
jgi:endonuclease/exonuclease/phosphatase family metal-dependent hydrolase